MGWTSSADYARPGQVWFETKEEAVAYATRNGLAYRVEEPRQANRRTMAYSDNFPLRPHRHLDTLRSALAPVGPLAQLDRARAF